LLFERFLNPQRVSMPDIDIDFAPEGRDEIIGYVMETYGRDHVAQIITFGTMAARAAIRDVGRAMNIPIPQVDRIVKLLPSGVSLADEEAISKVQELEDLLEQNSKLRTLMRVAGALEGLPRHSSTHASGVVISREPLVQRVPLQRAGDVAITQYAMADIEAIGLLKMDFLGVEELSVLEHTVRLIEKTRGETVDLEEIPLDDERTYELLSQGDTVGVFQLSSELGKRTLRQVKPGIFEDIIATVALVRPGPGAMTPEYVRRKNFGAQVEYPHPSLVPILEETYGIMLYQEQVMQVASVLAGFTLAEADQLRRGMAKKDPKALTALKERFLEGCECRGIHEEVALRIFDSMEYFSGYGFNKSHAAAYARIAYESAYLRANYPTEFMAAALTRERNNYDKLSLYIEDCRRKGIRVEGPDVNESSGEFTPFGDKKIRFGLEAVKNVGRNAVEAIMAGRDKHGRFTSLFDFCEKVDMAQVNKKAIESLIRAGALDSLGAHRAQLLGVYEVAADRGGRLQREKASGQTSLFDLVENPHALGAGEPQLPDIPPFSKRQLLEMEKELLGFYVSGHPLEDMEKLLHMITNVSVAELPNCQDGSQVSIGGILRHVRQLTTKSGKLMSFLNLEGITGNVEVIMFPDVHREFSTYLQPEEAFLVIGRLELRENSIKVIAQSLAPLKDGIVIIKTPSEDGRGELLKLQSTLTHYKGQVPVFLKMGIGEKEALILTTPGSWVLPTDELFSQVKALLGEDAPMYLPSKLAIESA
jgi:DNA polymerase-3 subunit alpha